MSGGKDAAAADVGVEARHRAALRMVRAHPHQLHLRMLFLGALSNCTSLCLDNARERERAVDVLLHALRESDDARFLRELLGADPADRATRMHAHGALLERGAQAAWRLAGGDVVINAAAAAEEDTSHE